MHTAQNTDAHARFATIRYERRAHVGTLTLARPAQRNAVNPAMRHELAALGEELAADDDLRCLVVAGDGPSFCAGIDLNEDMIGTFGEFADHPVDEAAVDRGVAVAGVYEWIPRLRCPSVAAVRGHAYGAGLQLAIACDFRILADDARVGLVETRYGLLPDMGATFRLPRLIGDARARELILLGDVIDAAEALRIGLATRVAAPRRLETATAEFAARLAALPPLAVTGARRAIDTGWLHDAATSLRVAVQAQADCLRSDEFTRARRALHER